RVPVAKIYKVFSHWATPIDEEFKTVQLVISKTRWDAEFSDVHGSNFGPRTLGIWTPKPLQEGHHTRLVIHIQKDHKPDIYFHDVDLSTVFNGHVSFVRVLNTDNLNKLVYAPKWHPTIPSVDKAHEADELAITELSRDPDGTLYLKYHPVNYPAFS
ncbi:hypothetical protein AX14_006584, partial [Amanita brunnescens Koide BX004]